MNLPARANVGAPVRRWNIADVAMEKGKCRNYRLHRRFFSSGSISVNVVHRNTRHTVLGTKISFFFSNFTHHKITQSYLSS
jgi:hypothetical protein